MKPRILNIEPSNYSKEAREIICTFAKLDETQLTRPELIERIHEYDGLIVRFGHYINSEVFKNASRLKVIATSTTGLNHIDLEEAKRHDVIVLSLKGEREFLDTISATAEHTWGLVLSIVRKIPIAVNHVKSGGWQRDLFRGEELSGKILGIIGLGRLGLKVAEYGLAFKMKVIAYDPYVSRSDFQIYMTDFRGLLEKSDIITVHVPYEENTRNLVSKQKFMLMKKGAYFINTSRGEVIDEEALLEALLNNHLSGAALDVLSGENLYESSFLKDNHLISYAVNHDNLIITPHIGGATWDSMRKTEIFIAEKLKEFFNDNTK